MVLRKAFACLIILFVFLSFPIRGSWAGISISPAYVEVNLDKGRPAGQFIISNLGDEEERYRIRAVHFTFLKDGGVRRIEPDEQSLAPWIKFNPTEFTLGPKSKRAIRYVITPQGSLRTREYWAAMELESLKTTMASGKDQAGREYHIEVIPSILVPIFAKFGNVRYQGSLKEATVVSTDTGQRIHFLVANTGEGRLLVEGQYQIRNSSGEEVQRGSITRSYVLPGLEQILVSPLKSDLAQGAYKVRVECHSAGLKQPIKHEFDVVWKPPS